MIKGTHHTEEVKTRISLSMRGQRNSLGCHHSKETKTKVSHTLKGNKNALGYRYTEEQRANLSRAKIGHPVSAETKMKIRIANTGKQLSEETKDKIRASLRTPEVREKRRQLALGNKYSLGHHHTEEAKAKMSRWRTGRPISEAEKDRLRHLNTNPVFTLETRLKISQAGQGRKDTEETRIKKSKVRIGMKFTEQHCINVGRSKKIAWSNPEWRDKVVKAQRLGCHIHPNKAEVALFELLELEYPGEWKFVGDGSLIIGGKNPDFANVNGRKELIELFGDYWHKGEDPQNRIDLFKSYGFKTLVIWESELENLDEVLGRIVEFI